MQNEEYRALITERLKRDVTMKAKQFLVEDMNASSILIDFRERLKPNYRGMPRSDFFVDASITVVGHLVDGVEAGAKAKVFWGNDSAVEQYVNVLEGWCNGHTDISGSMEGFQEAFLEIITGLPPRLTTRH
jgi:hypothetical protein